MNRWLVYVLAVIIVACSQPEPNIKSLGEAYLKVSGTAEAVQYFDKGLLLLHSFEYEDARSAFRQASNADPSMCMAYWGEALTYNHSLWGEQAYDSARIVLNKIEHNCEPQTELENDLLKSLEILYKENKLKAERDSLYAEHFRSLSEKYPDNDDIKAFYALSILGSVQNGRDAEKYAKAGAIASEVVAAHPKHPGGLHYLIHAYDDPINAEKALDAAYSYAKVAPAASHALHMPSHIFVAKGLWNDVVRSNEESYAASVNRMERKGLDNDARGYHAYQWLQYGYLQQGRIAEAQRMAENMVNYAKETPSIRGRTYVVYLKGAFLAETMNIQSPVTDIEVDVSDLNISTKAKYYTTSGFKAYHSHNADSLRSLINILSRECRVAEIFLDTTDFKICTTITRESPRRGDIDAAYVMIDQMKAFLATLEGNPDEAEKFMQSAIQKELASNYSYGPPRIQKPSTELYADWLKRQSRNREALHYYRKTLERAPNRTWSVQAIEDLRSKGVEI